MYRYKCEVCGNPKSFNMDVRGKNGCPHCWYSNLKKTSINCKKVALTAFCKFCLPCMFFIFAIISLLTNVNIILGGIASICWFVDIVWLPISGHALMKNFKAYVGDPEMMVVSGNVYIDDKGKLKINDIGTGEDYSTEQKWKQAYNVFIVILGTIVVALFGWLIFIISAAKYYNLSKKFVEIYNKEMDEYKKEIELDFDVDLAKTIVKDKSEKVMSCCFGENRKAKFIPMEIVAGKSADIDYIYGVINFNTGAIPMVLVSYNDCRVVFPSEVVVDYISYKVDSIKDASKQNPYKEEVFKKEIALTFKGFYEMCMRIKDREQEIAEYVGALMFIDIYEGRDYYELKDLYTKNQV